jgi:hypothetical protein
MANDMHLCAMQGAHSRRSPAPAPPRVSGVGLGRPFRVAHGSGGPELPRLKCISFLHQLTAPGLRLTLRRTGWPRRPRRWLRPWSWRGRPTAPCCAAALRYATAWRLS